MADPMPEMASIRPARQSPVAGRFRRPWRPDLEHVTIAAATAHHGVVGFLMMSASGSAPASEAARLWTWCSVAAAALLAGLWLFHLMPLRGCGAVAFGVGADLMTASCLLLMTSSAHALTGAVLFAVSGAFFTFYLGRPWLIWHMVFAPAVVCVLAAVTISRAQQDTYTTFVLAYLVVGVIEVLPMTIQSMWGRVALEARFAVTDHLTGVVNRRGLTNYVESELSNVTHGLIVACVVVDIDRFKAVNDEHGHATGDRVIAHTAATLVRSVSGSGTVARTGGEEFTIVIIDVPYAVGSALSRIPTTISGVESSLPTVTVSVGCATAPVHMGRPELVWHTVARADRSMYLAKGAGGRQFVMAEDGV